MAHALHHIDCELGVHDATPRDRPLAGGHVDGTCVGGAGVTARTALLEDLLAWRGLRLEQRERRTKREGSETDEQTAHGRGYYTRTSPYG